VPTPNVLAFKGNARRCQQKLIKAVASINLWLTGHDDWPLRMFSDVELGQLAAIVAHAKTNLQAKIPKP
jgi:hypothetical protein